MCTNLALFLQLMKYKKTFNINKYEMFCTFIFLNVSLKFVYDFKQM